MKLNKIIAIIVLLLFALGTFAPIALAESTEDYQKKLDDLEFQYIELQDQYSTDIFSVIEPVVTSDADAARLKLDSIENKLWDIESGVYQIRGSLLYEVSQGNFQVGDGSDKDDLLNRINAFIGELSLAQGFFWKSEEALDMMVAYERAVAAHKIASVDLDRTYGLQAQIEDLIYQKGSPSLVETKTYQMNNAVKDVQDAIFEMVDNQYENELISNEFGNKFKELISDLENLADNAKGLDEYAFAYVVVYDLAPESLVSLKASHTKLAKEHNELLCAKKSTSTVLLALKKIESDISQGTEALVIAREVAGDSYNEYMKTDANDLVNDFVVFDSEVDKTIAKNVGTDCSSTPTPTPTPTPVSKDEWIEFSDLETDYDEIEDDYFFYKKKVDKARTQKDSKDEEKYEDKLKDLDDNVEDLAKEIKDLEDKVEKNTSIKDQKKLLDKIEEFADDAEKLEDDIEKVIKGTASSIVSPSSSTISVNNFVPKSTTPNSGTVLVEKINFPTGLTQTQPVVQQAGEDSFAEVILLIGGIVIIIVVIMFLLAAMLMKKK
jgi:hypothetical protein